MQQAIRDLLIKLFSQHGLPLKLNGYEVDEFDAMDHPVIETSTEAYETIRATPFGVLEERARIAIASSVPGPGTTRLWSARPDVKTMAVMEIGRLLSTRFRYFDTECIYDDRNYAALLLALAELTGDEWQPQNVVSRLNVSRTRAFLELHDPLWPENAGFRSWTFYQDDDWVSKDFDNVIKSLGEYLPGTFVYLPSADQCSRVVYLPHQAAAELTSLLNDLASVK